MSNLTLSHQVDFWRHPAYMTLLYVVAYSAVFLMGLVGNSLVIIVFVVDRSMRVTTSYFITSLAVADLLVIVLCVPTTLSNNVLVRECILIR